MRARSIRWLVAFLALSACSSSSEPADSGEGESTPLYFLFNRIRSPEGRSMYASMLPKLDYGDVDVSNALELPGISRARIYKNKLYAFDGESLVISRYRIANDGSLSVDSVDGSPAQVSFAQQGIGFFYDSNFFVDDQRAFYIDYAQDVIIEWNPTEMTVTRDFPAGVLRDGFDASSGRISILDHYAVVPLSWQNSLSGTGIWTNAIGILDLDAPETLRVIEDDRCIGTSDTFVHDGAVYALGDSFGGLAVAVVDEPLPPPCLLRWQPGATAFDTDFYVDMSEATGTPAVAGAVSRGDGTFMTQAYVSDVDPSTLGVYELLDGNFWQRTIVSLNGDAPRLVTDVPPGPLSGSGFIVEGQYTFPRTDGDAGRATLYRFDGTAAAPQLTVPGEIFAVDRVR